MSNWDNLSLSEKAAMIKVAVKNGITNLQDIKREYNEFAEGGKKESKDYYAIMEKVAEDNYKDWGFATPDEALVHALNDNTYNYKGYYDKYPQSEANANTHWTDEFKTVWHPTFSNESIYSGKKSQYNPNGLPGGLWAGESFIPRTWQVLENNKFAKGEPKKKPSVNGNAQRAMDYFMNKGLSQHQAAGLVGNLMRESGMSPTAVNSSSGAYGLAQWLGPRKKALFNKYGNNPTFNQQLDFVWDELNSTHKKGLKALKSSKSAEEAARNAMGYYEFMAGPDAAVREMMKYGQDGKGSMKKGINYASILMGHSPSKFSIASIQSQDSPVYAESPIPFTPFNPEAFFAAPNTYQQPTVVEEPEVQEPITISPYSPEELERQERIDRLSAFNKILSFANPYPQEEDSFLSTISLLTGKTLAAGGKIHIDPSKKGTFTAAASKHGMGVQEFASKVLANKENYSPAMVKKANFARNTSKWHGLGGNLFDDGGSYSYTKPLHNVYVDSEGNLLDPSVPSARGTIQLPEVIATTRDPRKAIPTANRLNIPDASLELKRRFYDHITPAGYALPITRTVAAALNPGRVKTIEVNPRTRRGKTIYPGLISALRDDLFAEYLQIPKEERHKVIINTENNAYNSGEIEETSLRPTNAENDKYFKFKNLSNLEKDRLVKLGTPLSVGSNTLSGALRAYLGEHTIGHGHDTKGDYVSYYDNWDLAPFTGKGEDQSLGIGKPVNIYDRIYLDDYFGMPKEYRGSTYIPEVTVYNKKKK